MEGSYDTPVEEIQLPAATQQETAVNSNNKDSYSDNQVNVNQGNVEQKQQEQLKENFIKYATQN